MRFNLVVVPNSLCLNAPFFFFFFLHFFSLFFLLFLLFFLSFIWKEEKRKRGKGMGRWGKRKEESEGRSIIHSQVSFELLVLLVLLLLDHSRIDWSKRFFAPYWSWPFSQTEQVPFPFPSSFHFLYLIVLKYSCYLSILVNILLPFTFSSSSSFHFFL